MALARRLVSCILIFLISLLLIVTLLIHHTTGAKGFRMRVEITQARLIKGLMAQDPIHVCKKFDCKVVFNS